MVISSFKWPSMVPAVIGGVGIWLLVIVGNALTGTLFPGTAEAAKSLDRSAVWFLTTLVVSLLLGTMLLLAQVRLREQRLRGAVGVGIALGVLGSLGVLAAGINSGAITLATFRAAVLLCGVICASMLVFAARAKSRE